MKCHIKILQLLLSSLPSETKVPYTLGVIRLSGECILLLNVDCVKVVEMKDLCAKRNIYLKFYTAIVFQFLENIFFLREVSRKPSIFKVSRCDRQKS